MDFDLRQIGRRRRHYRPRIEPRSGGEQYLSSAKVSSARPDVPGRPERPLEAYDTAVARHLLLDHNAIGARWNRSTGEDAHAGPLADFRQIGLAGKGFAGQPQPGRQASQIRLAHGIAVHRRDVGARGVETGDDVGGKNPSGGLVERDALDRGALRQRGNARAGFIEADHSADRRFGLPPALAVGRRSATHMPRSIAPGMSWGVRATALPGASISSPSSRTARSASRPKATMARARLMAPVLARASARRHSHIGPIRSVGDRPVHPGA